MFPSLLFYHLIFQISNSDVIPVNSVESIVPAHKVSLPLGAVELPHASSIVITMPVVDDAGAPSRIPVPPTNPDMLVGLDEVTKLHCLKRFVCPSRMSLAGLVV